METRPESRTDPLAFSGLTCPECRGPLWEKEYGHIKEFQCRVGHVYSFESLVEQHAATTESALWQVILALEEEVILTRQAARQTSDPKTQQSLEKRAQDKAKQADVIRDMLTRPDPAFGPQAST